MKYPNVESVVCCVLTEQDDKVLGITRLNPDGSPDYARWAFPGGHVEPGEDLESAVKREILEETGYHIANCHPIYTGISETRPTAILTAYTANIVKSEPDAPRSKPYEGDVAWVPPSKILEGAYPSSAALIFNQIQE